MAAVEGRFVGEDDELTDSEIAHNNKIIERPSPSVVVSSPASLYTAESLSSFQDEVDLDTWEAPEEIRRNYVYYHSGYDKENRPIWIAEVGKWNMRKITAEGPETMKMFARYVRQGTYRAVKSVMEINTPEKPVTEAIIIVDMTSLNMFQLVHIPTLGFVFQLAKEHKAVVMRHMHVGIVINTNNVAHTAIKLVKPILGKLMDKVEVFASDRDKWEPRVLRFCPADQIPALYGGENADFRPVKSFV